MMFLFAKRISPTADAAYVYILSITLLFVNCLSMLIQNMFDIDLNPQFLEVLRS